MAKPEAKAEKKVEKKVVKTRKAQAEKVSVKSMVYAYAKENYKDVRPKEMYELVSGIFELISGKLKEGVAVSVNGFGVFRILSRKARIGHNPQNNKKINIPAKKVVKFKPVADIREALKSA